MAESPRPFETWQFSLRTLFFAVTTSAIGCGVAASELPLELKYAGLCAPVFWAGIAATLFGSAVIDAQSTAVQIAGEYAMSLGFVVSFMMILVGSFAAAMQILLLLIHFVAYLAS